jgi:hypothetical protein
MFQHLFHRRKKPTYHFAPTIFLGLIAIFVIILQLRPVVGLAGLGTTLILAASLVILNRERIWLDYKKSYKKKKGLPGHLTKPNSIYYTINIFLLWPFIAALGVVSLIASYVFQN